MGGVIIDSAKSSRISLKYVLEFEFCILHLFVFLCRWSLEIGANAESYFDLEPLVLDL
jgi:hypothetical protein